MFSLNGTLKKSGSVGRAMGNETIYWDGLNENSIRPIERKCLLAKLEN